MEITQIHQAIEWIKAHLAIPVMKYSMVFYLVQKHAINDIYSVLVVKGLNVKKSVSPHVFPGAVWRWSVEVLVIICDLSWGGKNDCWWRILLTHWIVCLLFVSFIILLLILRLVNKHLGQITAFFGCWLKH